MTNSFTPQLSLGLGLNRSQSFDNFFVTRQSSMLVNTLQQFIDQKISDFVYISGSPATGKTHILLAVHQRVVDQGRTALYLPLSEVKDYPPAQVLEGQANIDYLLIDDLQSIETNTEWQQALFHLHNERHEKSLSLILASRVVATELPLSILKDLRTRCEACLSFQLHPFNDAELADFLDFLLRQRGMLINESCQQFILLRASRDIASLTHIVDTLDAAQISAGRKVTVPFIKELFAW